MGAEGDKIHEQEAAVEVYVVCSSCGRANRTDARFCDRCSTDLHATCLECGAEAAADHVFCPRCGSRLLDPTMPVIPQPHPRL